MSICAHAILQPGVLVVPDTQDDPLFADNPLVSGDPQCQLVSAESEPAVIARRYGASELCSASGQPLGVLPEAHYQAQSFLLESEDCVILSTDVITEARLGQLPKRSINVCSRSPAVASGTTPVYCRPISCKPHSSNPTLYKLQSNSLSIFSWSKYRTIQ